MKISVIIPSLNAASSLELTLQSILRQTHTDHEIVVMDGGSTDGTRGILEKYAKQIGYWQSAADQGTSHAINDGLRKCSGDLVTILCADDRIHSPDVFARVTGEFQNHPETGVLCSALEMHDLNGLVPPYVNPSNPAKMRREGALHLPGAFFRREILQKRPLSYEVDMANDYEIFAYLTEKTNIPIRVVPWVTVAMSLGGRTNNIAFEFQKIRECFVVRRKYYGFFNAWGWRTWDTIIATLRTLHFRPYTWQRKARQALLRNRLA